MRISLNTINIEEAAREASVPPSTLRYDLVKVIQTLPEVLVNQTPGPKPQSEPAETTTGSPAKEPTECRQCGGKVSKNGTYWVLNWLRMLVVGWLGVQRVRLQRRRCMVCGHEIISPERACQAEARQAWWHQVNRLASLSHFKLRLSVRMTQILVQFVYARPVSIGYVERLTQRTGKRAAAALDRLGECRQAMARFLLYDETYPKMQKRFYSLGVAICEHGLIRSVRCIVRKAKDIPTQLQDVVGPHFQPKYFLTDLDVLFNKYMRTAGRKLTHLRDRVHLIRQVVRLFDEAVQDVSLDVPKGLPLKERKRQRRLKRRLLRKYLQPMLALVFKAFSPSYESICVLMLEGVVSQLQVPTCIIQTSSVQTLARRLQRFVKKHGQAVNTLLLLSVEQDTPTTTNSLESKNGIFKSFSLIAKFFPCAERCQSFFAGVALMENFDIKTRGPNQGTSAIQHAKIN